MTDDKHPPEDERKRELWRKGRIRNKHRLLDKWDEAGRAFDGPGQAVLVDGYRPSGFMATYEAEEIAGLIVTDTDGRNHKLRLHRDETAYFLGMTENSDPSISIDPMIAPGPNKKLYDIDGPPLEVIGLLAALEIEGRWENACEDGEHEFQTVNEGTAHEFTQCAKCENGPSVLSWLGHTV